MSDQVIKKKKSAPRQHNTELNFNPNMNKKTTNLEFDPSYHSGFQDQQPRVRKGPDGRPLKKTLTKKETLMYKPSEIGNKLLETVLLKVAQNKLRACQKRCGTKST